MRLVLFLTAAACFAREFPFVFEPNTGQAPAQYDYVGRSSAGTVLLGSSGAVMLPPSADKPVRLTFRGGRATASEALDKLPGHSNYLSGADRSKWRRHIPHYSRVRYAGVYPGIDVVYYSAGSHLEYDFVLAPGSSPDRVALSFDGADSITTETGGDLLIASGSAVIRHRRPRVFQDGRTIEARYRITGNTVRIALGPHDTTRKLIIDPVIEFSTLVGREGYETATSIAIDSFGNSIIAGETTSADFATPGAFQRLKTRDTDAWVAKVGRAGELQFVTYFGGNRNDLALGAGTDSAGNVYLSGVTFSSDLPVLNAPQASFGGGVLDSFAAKLSANGSELLWATYLGGNGEDWTNSMAVDSEGGAWVAGWTKSGNFPVTFGLQNTLAGGGGDAFVTRIAPAGRTFTWSSYLGSTGADSANGIDVDERGIVYLTGSTTSAAFPTAGAVQSKAAGLDDAFILKLDPARNKILLSMFLGGSGNDNGIRVAADREGNAYVVGYTGSADLPVTAGALQAKLAGKTDLFVAKMDGVSGSLRYATYLGGTGEDWAGDIVADDAGTAYVTGWTNSTDFPVRNAAQSTLRGGSPGGKGFDALVARLAPGGDSLLYSSYFGELGEDRAFGIALDRSGGVRIAGTTTSENLQAGNRPAAGGGDAFVAGISADFAVNLLTAQPSSLMLTARSGDTTPQQASVALRATGGSLQWTAETAVPWLRVTTPGGTTPGTIGLSLEAGALPPGTHTGTVVVRTGSGSVTIPVSVTVGNPPSIASITPAGIPAGSPAASITLTGSGFIPASTVEVNGIPVASSVIDGGTIRFTIPAEMLRAPAAFDVVVVNPDLRSAPVRLAVRSDGPAITAVAHAATWRAGAVAPGEIVVLGGTGFGADAKAVSVYFDGNAAPVLWSVNGQIAAVVPRSVASRTTTEVSVESSGVRSLSVWVPVQPAAPGLFTANSSGQGQAAALNQDGSANSPASPASRGSVLVLYGTGEGLISPALPDGAIVAGDALPRPVLPVSVRIGGVDAVIEYAGSVPGSPAGLFQVNARVPGNSPTGDAVAVSLSVGPHTSPAGTTVAVR